MKAPAGAVAGAPAGARAPQCEAEERVYRGCGQGAEAEDEWRVYVEKRRRRLLALVNYTF